jgi:predicted nuclease of restriction endonuclease-like RecB superfamily
MLTKDLLRLKIVSGCVRPQFIDCSNPELLELAEQLLECYQMNEGESLSLEEINAATEMVLRSYRDEKLSRGLNKVILDRCKFSSPDDFDYQASRREVFAASAKALQTMPADAEPETLMKIARASLRRQTCDFIDAGIYSDLPGNENLIRTPALFKREVLERYNCALVQSLLLYSDSLEIIAEDPEPAKMRKMFKYLKFFRLLAKISSVPGCRRFKDAPSKLKIVIDGPVSLFENTQKYGLQLACFFPAMLELDKWKLKCTVKYRDKELKLNLDESSALVSHYRNFSSYVPGEIAMFHRLFKSKVSDWHISGNTPLFQADKHELIFPDLSFTGENGVTIHLELFHRWHSTSLLERLEFCDSHPELPLIIGVDRALYKKPEIKARIDGSTCFARSGFLFRDFPGVDNVRKLLDSKSAASD